MSHGDEALSDERQAVDRLRSGDIGGLEVLVQRHQLQATRAAHLVVRDRQLAEDIVCDAFLRCSERIQQFDTSRPFAPWFLRIVVNDALKAAERRTRHVSLDTSRGRLTFADLLPDQGAGPDVAAERAELRRDVEVALRSLTPRQRAAIVLYYYVGLSGPEIAEHLSSPLGTVKRRLHDGRARLRTLLGDTR